MPRGSVAPAKHFLQIGFRIHGLLYSDPSIIFLHSSASLTSCRRWLRARRFPVASDARDFIRSREYRANQNLTGDKLVQCGHPRMIDWTKNGTKNVKHFSVLDRIEGSGRNQGADFAPVLPSADSVKNRMPLSAEPNHFDFGDEGLMASSRFAFAILCWSSSISMSV